MARSLISLRTSGGWQVRPRTDLLRVPDAGGALPLGPVSSLFEPINTILGEEPGRKNAPLARNERAFVHYEPAPPLRALQIIFDHERVRDRRRVRAVARHGAHPYRSASVKPSRGSGMLTR